MFFHATIGIPGSGKSTYVKKLMAAHPSAKVIHPDAIREDLTGSISDQSKNGIIFSQIVPQKLREAAQNRQDVIYDATCVSVKARDIFKLAKLLGYITVAHVMKTSHEESRARNKSRERVVPDFVMDRMIAQYQYPDKEKEAIDEIIEVS